MSFLCLRGWEETEIIEERTHYFVRAVYRPRIPKNCPHCLGRGATEKFGARKRSLKDSPVRGKPVTIFLTIQLYRCVFCNKVFPDEPPELVGSSRLTARLIFYIIKGCIKKTYSEVSRETAVSPSTISELFTKFVESSEDRLSFQYPRVLGIDDVFIGRVPRCVLTDIENRKVIELLPRRKIEVVYGFFSQIKGRENTEVVTMDMHRPFHSAAQAAFRNAKIVIDTFHVQSKCNQAIKDFLTNVREMLNMSRRRLVLHDRFLLLKRYYNLTEAEKDRLKSWKAKWPELAEVYDLKEEFFMIWRLTSRQEAEAKYAKWKNGMSAQARKAFSLLTTMVENWYEEIFNYFDHRYTNAFTESANNLIKRLQSEGRGYDFETLRTKILLKYHMNDISEDNTSLIAGSGSRSGLSRMQRLKAVRESKVIYYFPGEDE